MKSKLEIETEWFISPLPKDNERKDWEGRDSYKPSNKNQDYRMSPRNPHLSIHTKLYQAVFHN